MKKYAIAIIISMLLVGCSPDVIWSHNYYRDFGHDTVYIDSNGKIYKEGETENPNWQSSGATSKTYTGKKFTKEELEEFFNIEDEDEQKEVLNEKGVIIN